MPYQNPIILCVDDSQTVIAFLSAYLSKNNFHVETAFDGEEGLEKMRALRPSIVLLDINMPKLSGFDVALAAMYDPDLASIPIIILSSLSQTHNKERSELRNVCDYLTKPVNSIHLLKIINRCLLNRGIHV